MSVRYDTRQLMDQIFGLGASADIVAQIALGVAGSTAAGVSATAAAGSATAAAASAVSSAASAATFTPTAGVAGVTISATTGVLPTAASTQVIGNATTGATVAELLALCVSINAKVAALDAALHTSGILTS
jgi:hypothetical protein